jgi:hypothetical protein
MRRNEASGRAEKLTGNAPTAIDKGSQAIGMISSFLTLFGQRINERRVL